jgi:hypothetical protein
MKKMIVIMLLFLGGILNAQNYLHVNITEIQNWMTYEYCSSTYDGVVIEKETGCNTWIWSVVFDGQEIIHAINELDEIILEVPENVNKYYTVHYIGCESNYWDFNFIVKFVDFQAPEPWSQSYMWKRTGTSVNLQAYGGYNYQWSTGSTNSSITIIDPGTYWVHVYNDCGELYDTIQVRDNVEIDLATCDLETNLNIVTWPTTPAQAEYVGQVVIKRDGIQIGTANYADGYFLDNIGSDAASRTYTLTAVATDGTECPIVSYPKETIHMAYLTGINNTIEVNWNVPAGYDLLGYNICEWHEDDGSLTVIDYVGASVTSYTCSESQFDEGYIVVQGVETGKDGETRLLSNRSLDIIVGLGENEAAAFKVYPNPANGILFVETCHGASLQMETYRIVNPIGQTVMEGQITMEKQQIDVRNLPKGVYFITVGGATRKFVVE